MIRVGVAWLCAVIQLSGVVSAAPVIWCKSPEWDFGTIADSGCVTNSFPLENRGQSSLLISAIKSSCGCTTATLPIKQLAPGEQVAVTAIFDPVGREGHQRKVIRIYSNDLKAPVLNLLVTGRVNPQGITLPSAITFNARSSDKIIERTLTLTYDRPVQIQSMELDSPAVTLKSAGSQSARSHVIVVAIDPMQVSGRFRGELKISTDHPSVPVTRVPVIGQVKK